MTFEKKLKALRKKNRMSQEEMAERLNVSRQAISKWELGSILDRNNQGSSQKKKRFYRDYFYPGLTPIPILI